MEWPEITKDTPIEEIMRIHRMIWDYVIKHNHKPNTPYLENCVLCDFAYILNNNNFYRRCVYCPTNLDCCDSASLYEKWFASIFNGEDYLEYARQIRDIKLKEEYQNGRSENPVRSSELSE